VSSPTPAQHNLVIPLKTDFEREFRFKQPNGDPVDLTGAEAVFTVWSTDEDDETPVKLNATSDPDEGVVVDGPNGSVTVSWPKADNEGETPGRYRYRLRVITAGGKTHREVEGFADLTADAPEVSP